MYEAHTEKMPNSKSIYWETDRQVCLESPAYCSAFIVSNISSVTHITNRYDELRLRCQSLRIDINVGIHLCEHGHTSVCHFSKCREKSI